MRIVTGNFGEELKYIGKVVRVDQEKAYVISAEREQAKAGRIQRRSFLVVPVEAEAFLFRVVNAKSMCCDNDERNDSALFECKILGAFREDGSTVVFDDVDDTLVNLRGRSVYKPVGETLNEIVNFDVPSSPASYHGIKAGRLKYTALQSGEASRDIEVYINHTDPLGCATAVLGSKDITMPDDIVTTLIRAAAESGTSMRACSEENTPQIGQIIIDFGRNYAHIVREYSEITRHYLPSKAKELSENDIQEIIDLARRGYIAIVDIFSIDSDERRRLAARICGAVYESSSQRMRDGLQNNYIQIYITKYAQDFIGDGQLDPCGRIYNKIAEDGEKLKIGLVYATDIPSLITPTMIAETKNIFVSISRLMHKDERDAVKRLKGFEDLTGSVRYDPRADHLYMLTRSRPFVVPVQTA